MSTEDLLKKQRENCLVAWKAVGKKRFTRFGSKAVTEAILSAEEPDQESTGADETHTSKS